MRELREEVGIAVEPDDMNLAAKFLLHHDNIHDEVFLFEVTFSREPVVCVDNREVTRAWFEDPDAALTGNLSAVARHILHQYKHQLIGHRQ